MSTTPEHSEMLIRLESLEDFRRYSLQLVSSTRRRLAILSRSLDAPIYDSEPFTEAISLLARSSRYASIQLLVKDTDPLIERGHRLVKLAERLSSKIMLKKLTQEPANTDMGFLLSDATGLLYKNDESVYRGFAHTAAAAEVRRLREIFDYLWQYAEPEPRLQRLYL